MKEVNDTVDVPWGGSKMTLRDYFAAAALNGTMSNQEWLMMVIKAAELKKTDSLLTISKQCYEFADAMLKVREY